MLQYVSEISTVATALKEAAAAVESDALDAARTTAQSEWVAALGRLASEPLDDDIILIGATVEITGDHVTLIAANSGAPLTHGLIPSEQWQGEEFGARTRRATIATHSRNGKPYNVTKMLNRQFPNRHKYSRVGFRAASETGTEIVRATVKAIIDRIATVPGVEVVP